MVVPTAPLGERGMMPTKLLLTPDEAAEVLGVSRSMLYRMLMRREILSVKLGAARRVPLQALQDYVRHLCLAAKAG